MSRPEIAVVVPSHERAVRLRWLLNALEEQTLAADRWEVVVAHDSRSPAVRGLLDDHPLARSGRLREVWLPPGTGTPTKHRNAGWRAARAPLVAFTDDDCRPTPSWLERCLAAAREHPGAVVQGATKPDPDEAHLLRRAAHARTIDVDPPDLFGQGCNIVYPRALLERLGGVVAPTAGEDTDLLLRALEGGAGYVGAPDALTFHAVDAPLLVGRLRSLPRWEHIAYVVRRHPAVRRWFTARVFWKRRHAWLLLALAGVAFVRRRPGAVALVMPWAWDALPRYGTGARGRLRAVTELPGRAAIDVTELFWVLRGAVRYRTLIF